MKSSKLVFFHKFMCKFQFLWQEIECSDWPPGAKVIFCAKSLVLTSFFRLSIAFFRIISALPAPTGSNVHAWQRSKRTPKQSKRACSSVSVCAYACAHVKNRARSSDGPCARARSRALCTISSDEQRKLAEGSPMGTTAIARWGHILGLGHLIQLCFLKDNIKLICR